MTRRARVVGTGLAGLTCAHLLAARRWDVECWDLGGDPIPPLVLNDVTAQLVRELWGDDVLADEAVRLRARTVRWGDSPPATMPHSAVVVDGRVLRGRLLDRLTLEHRARVHVVEVNDAALAGRLTDRAGVTTFDATGRGARAAAVLGQARRRTFGRRCVLAAAVTLTRPRTPDTCWMESTAEGWVFLAPTGEERAVLQAMVPLPPSDPDATLRQVWDGTRLVSERVGELASPVAVFPAAPACSEPLLGDRWIAIGDAALAWDPVSGDGTGHGLRGAILATAVTDAIARDEPPRPCLAHYAARLDEALRVHLHRCLAYYATMSSSPAWAYERAVTADALWAMTAPPPAYSYRLDDFHLVPAVAPRARCTRTSHTECARDPGYVGHFGVPCSSLASDWTDGCR